MTFLLTNDDGIDAPGLQSLFQAVKSLNRDEKIMIAAPKECLSGCGHQVTTHRPIHVEKRSDFAYQIDGTPADCIRLGLTHLFPNSQFILSGINAGANLGVDRYISGTVAAVREAAMFGIPAIAVSHWIKRPLTIDWDLATKWTTLVLKELLNRPHIPGTFWNVNLTHLQPESQPKIVFCFPSNRPLPIEYKIDGNYFHYIGEYAQRERHPGSDVDVCFSGNIAITQISV